MRDLRARMFETPRGDRTAAVNVRVEKRFEIGDQGAVYEFDVKIQKLDAAGMSDADFQIERDLATEAFVERLQRRYPWIEFYGFHGRSGGWLALRDVKGARASARMRSLHTIAALVAEARQQFIRDIEFAYSRKSA